jgi:hypothetical protein
MRNTITEWFGVYVDWGDGLPGPYPTNNPDREQQSWNEFDPQENNYILRPRVARNVDGMDFDLFERALHVRRNFEAQLLATRSFDWSEVSLEKKNYIKDLP